jgi:hypothetical protein
MLEVRLGVQKPNGVGIAGSDDAVNPQSPRSVGQRQSGVSRCRPDFSERVDDDGAAIGIGVSVVFAAREKVMGGGL